MMKHNFLDQLSFQYKRLKRVQFLGYGCKYFSIWDELRPELLT